MQQPPSKTWIPNPGASNNALHALVSIVGTELPQEYLDFLAYSNGGEGPLPPPFHTLCLDPAEAVANADQIKLSNELYPGWLVFGGDGGGQLYAFDLTGIGPRPVIRFDGIDPQGSFEKVAVDFASFIKLMAETDVDS